MDKKLLDLFTDYLITSTALATATGLSEIFDNVKAKNLKPEIVNY